MGGLSPVHWLLLIAVALLLFGGRGKVSGLMGDIAQGIKAFKKNMADDPPDASMTNPGTNSAPPPASKIAQDEVVKPVPVCDPVKQD